MVNGNHDRSSRQRWIAIVAAICTVAVSLGMSRAATAADWPTYRHDSQRSGSTDESLELPLKRAWIWRSPNPPSPAWGGPAKADYYTTSQVPLMPRLEFDRCFHVAVVGDSVYFGSSAEDSVYRLNTANGSIRWCFTVESPVRMAPTVASGRVYFGADDGSVYCVSATSGELVWKYTASGSDNYLVPSDGRFASPWPVRSGVVVDGGVAYFSAGIFPAEGVYVCAVDAATGSDQGAGHWKRKRLNNVSLQGYAVASATRLIFPAGRSSPYLFRRSDGNYLGQFAPDRSGSRGTFALISNDRLITGPASRGGALLEEYDSSTAGKDQIAVYDGGRSMVATSSRYFLLGDDSLKALNRANRSQVWRRDVTLPYELIAAQNVLFAGGKDQVAAFDATTGETVWTANVFGKARGLAVSGGKLYVSTDRGYLYAFSQESSADNAFVRGDANQDASVDIGDAMTVLFYLYVQAAVLKCEDHGDFDDNGNVEAADAIGLLSYLFLDGPPPKPPFPVAGTDPTADAHDCGNSNR